MSIINLNLKDLLEFLTHHSCCSVMYLAFFCMCLVVVLILLCFVMNKRSSCKVYLKDFACYKPPPSQKCSKELLMKQVRRMGYIPEEMLDFMKIIMEGCGLGDSTYLPEIFFKESYNPSMKNSRREVEMAIFGSVDMLLAKTDVKSEDIGILIVNCCIYNPVPSLSSIVINHYKLRENIISYNLSGMGCSAGLVAIGLAKQLLQVHHNSYALIVSTESITGNCYVGKDRSKFFINCLFRAGGAAILLSNRPSDHKHSKYQLVHTIHTNTSTSDQCYHSIFREEDNAGIVGVTINKHLVATAIATIERNIITLGYLILPMQEKVVYIARKLLPSKTLSLNNIPNFRKAIDHFLPHVGGKVVLDQLQKTLGFSEDNMEASRMTLFRYGNTSSSSIWYELAYVEAKGRVKRGNRVWQMAFGSGFKCQSVIWRAIKTVDHDDYNPWADEIVGFPVILEDIETDPFSFVPSK
ncbi:putative 3-Oxoacyl-[acyl-carrier-protein (ACP)] synthase III [Helianthus annuus]|nr:putative 3-Oxoacyl-[acyl-carrier-protein (ACP)] synthase III [Helianthus annuus]